MKVSKSDKGQIFYVSVLESLQIMDSICRQLMLTDDDIGKECLSVDNGELFNLIVDIPPK